MDDLLPRPNDTFWQPQEPAAQTKERTLEAAKAQAAIPQLEDILQRLEADLADLDKRSVMKDLADKHELSLEQAEMAMDIAYDRLNQMHGYVESLLQQYK